jgi:hypothetical protein
MAWVATAVVGTALVMDYVGAQKAEDAAYASGQANKKALLGTAEEQKRKLALQHTQELGGAGAVEGASNTQTVAGSGYDLVLKAMTEEFNKQMSWIDRAAQLGAKQSDAEVKSASVAINNQMYSSMIGAVGGYSKSMGWVK